MLRVASLCSGYAGLELALGLLVPCEPVLFAEIDKAASRVLKCRFPDVPNAGDLAKADWAGVTADIVTAGFPCQDVSCAGQRAGLREGTRTGVWYHVARAIEALRPKLVILENVRGLLSAGADSDMEPCPWCLGDDGDVHALRALGAVLGSLSDLGYMGRYRTVSAADAGAPHRRDRVFILAWPADAGHDPRTALYADCAAARSPARTAAHADGGTERARTLEAGHGLVAAVPGDPEPGGSGDGEHAPAADAQRRELQRRREPGHVGGAPPAQPRQVRQRQRARHAAVDGGAPAAHTAGGGSGSGEPERGSEGRAATGRDCPGVPPDAEQPGLEGLALSGMAGTGKPAEGSGEAAAHPDGGPARQDSRAGGGKAEVRTAPGDRPGNGYRPGQRGGFAANPHVGGRGLDRGREREGSEGQQRRIWAEECGEIAAADADRVRREVIGGIQPGLESRDDADGCSPPAGAVWGRFAGAIARWECVMGPAPSPTLPSGKGGSARLSPYFTEWMMGLPPGWVTGVPLSRTDQLRLLGNGVVPQQCALALCLLGLMPVQRGAATSAGTSVLLPTPNTLDGYDPKTEDYIADHREAGMGGYANLREVILYEMHERLGDACDPDG